MKKFNGNLTVRKELTGRSKHAIVSQFFNNLTKINGNGGCAGTGRRQQCCLVLCSFHSILILINYFLLSTTEEDSSW